MVSNITCQNVKFRKKEENGLSIIVKKLGGKITQRNSSKVNKYTYTESQEDYKNLKCQKQ